MSRGMTVALALVLCWSMAFAGAGPIAGSKYIAPGRPNGQLGGHYRCGDAGRWIGR